MSDSEPEHEHHHDDHRERVVVDEFRRCVIEEYEQEQADRRSMEQAMKEAEVALMPPKERFVFAHTRMLNRQRKWEKELQRILGQYRQTVRSCPLPFHDHGETLLEASFPYLILPRATGIRVLQQISEAVQNRLLRQYGGARDPNVKQLIYEMNRMWMQAATQYFGFAEQSVPHPDVLPCIVPNVHSSSSSSSSTASGSAR